MKVNVRKWEQASQLKVHLNSIMKALWGKGGEGGGRGEQCKTCCGCCLLCIPASCGPHGAVIPPTGN